ncbi:MAG: hypothetical protein IJX58_06955 [Clostridia bacterium]|nr:hypothetical protein [Clostridia bacterium]
MSNHIISIQFDSDIAKGNDAVRTSFYANIGFFIEVAQMFEFNLRKLICYERSVKEIEQGEITKENVEQICAKYDRYYDDSYLKKPKFTLGKLISEAKNDSSITTEFFDFLEELNDFRVNLVHKVFQNNIIRHDFDSAEFVLEYTNKRIIPMTNKAIELNKTIISIIDLYRTDLHGYKKQVGLPLPN